MRTTLRNPARGLLAGATLIVALSVAGCSIRSMTRRATRAVVLSVGVDRMLYASLRSHRIQYPEPFIESFHLFLDHRQTEALAQYCRGLVLNRGGGSPAAIVAAMGAVSLATSHDSKAWKRYVRMVLHAGAECALTTPPPPADGPPPPPPPPSTK
jgi:hypothetical protein